MVDPKSYENYQPVASWSLGLHLSTRNVRENRMFVTISKINGQCC